MITNITSQEARNMTKRGKLLKNEIIDYINTSIKGAAYIGLSNSNCEIERTDVENYDYYVKILNYIRNELKSNGYDCGTYITKNNYTVSIKITINWF